MPIILKDKDAADTTYNLLRSEGTRALYIGTNHSDIAKDTVLLNSNPPKRSGNSYGNRRASINIVRAVTVATPDGSTEVKDMKFELVSSMPVGTSVDDLNDIRARLSAALADDVLIEQVVAVGKTQL